MVFRRALLLLLLAIALHAAPAAADDGPAPLCFPETGHCLEAAFKSYWEGNGGLPVFGYPITTMQPEYSVDSGIVPMTQWLERNRFELHSQNPAPYHVLLGRLGAERLTQLGLDWREVPREEGPRRGCIWFEETGHNVCDQQPGVGFMTYWRSHGLEFGDRGVSFRESLALFGFPLTEPQMETNSSGDRVLTQWFERARFEWHPNNPRAYRVLLGRLGAEVLADREQLFDAAGVVAAIDHNEGVIVLEQPVNGISTIAVGQITRITRNGDGQPIPLYHVQAGEHAVWAFGSFIDQGVLYARYLVVTPRQ